MARGVGPPEPPVRREIVDLLRRFDPFRVKSDAMEAPAAEALALAPEERELLKSATDDEKRVAAVESLRALVTIIDMGDGTSGVMPADPDWP